MERELSLATAGITTKRDYDESQLVKAVGEDDLDRNAFLQLLTTQLQNQNPLDPMKNEAFVAQLAQFSQLEGITNMSTSLDEVTDVMKSDRIMTGANFVGKSVVAATGRITTDGESPASIELALPYGADQVDFGIYDTDTGNLVRSIVVGPQSSGNLKVQWDGQLADGNQATPGIYEIRAKVIRDGASQSQVPQTFSRVETVSWDALNSNLNLNLAGGVSLPMSQVTRVGESVISNSKTTDTSGE